MRRGVSAAAGRADMQRIADAGDRVFADDHNPRAQDNNVVVRGVQRPAQIVNYRTIGSTPVVLAIALAAGRWAPSPHLAASVRRRRRDLALLKALGFTRGSWRRRCEASHGGRDHRRGRGIPLGALMGRQLWILFADNLNAVPDPQSRLVGRPRRRGRVRLRQPCRRPPGRGRRGPHGAAPANGVAPPSGAMTAGRHYLWRVRLWRWPGRPGGRRLVIPVPKLLAGTVAASSTIVIDAVVKLTCPRSQP